MTDAERAVRAVRALREALEEMQRDLMIALSRAREIERALDSTPHSAPPSRELSDPPF